MFQYIRRAPLQYYFHPACLVIIMVAVHDINGDIVTVLEDLVEIDSLILDLEGRDYVLSVNAYETLKRKCSQDWRHLSIYRSGCTTYGSLSRRGTRCMKLS